MPAETFRAVQWQRVDPDNCPPLDALCQGNGGTAGLVALLGAKDASAAEQAAWALGALARGGEEPCDDIVAKGAPLQGTVT